MKKRDVTPAGRSAVNSQWEEGSLSENKSNRIITNDDVNSKSNEEKLTSDIVTLKPNRDVLKIGTWNVRTLYHRGKIDNCIMEMERLQIDVLGLAEVKWTESGIIDKGKYVMTVGCGPLYNPYKCCLGDMIGHL